MQNLQNLLFAALRGLLMGLTSAPFGQWWLAWIALIPLWMLAQKLKVKEAIASSAPALAASAASPSPSSAGVVTLSSA